ncbi:sugar kinase [Clostridium cochlearium]|uniref:Ribokinase-like domain-containing protein n=1 Tax=Clostridium cochlearium TaxID=1494 RepID=A0A2X2VY34_CLOCO|nr:sugar kinase [Clostridium cochlearium]SQB33568.1 ribokinase-like domain-containing protein [Clostridium cochlearium]
MEVITFGESMVVFNPEENGPLRYINGFYKSLGGAESNFAVALARLGHDVGWFSKLGCDEFGRYILNTIRGEGVDVSKVVYDEERSTGILFKERFMAENPNVYYYRKNSAASNLQSGDIDEKYIKSAKILHVTGITLALSKKTREAVFKAMDIAKENGVLVSFDPNIRLKLWNDEDVKDIMFKACKKSDIIFPGQSEGEILLETKDEKEIGKKLIELGAKIVVVKLGSKGCYCVFNKEECYVEGFKVDKIQDTVGAGDGFAAGFISGLVQNLKMQKCCKIANAVGAMATLVKGDMEGYPTRDQLLIFTGEKGNIDR